MTKAICAHTFAGIRRLRWLGLTVSIGGLACSGCGSEDTNGGDDSPRLLRSPIDKAVSALTTQPSVLTGRVVAWGQNDHGQADVPVALTDVIAVDGGQWHSMALKKDGSVVVWGDNAWGQASVPPALSGVIAISAGASQSIALRTDGTVTAWGRNDYGQTNVPSGLTDVTAISGGYLFNLALRRNGNVVGWGYNWHGEMNVADLSGIVAIAAGHSLSVALKNDGTVVARGFDGEGWTEVPPGLSGVTAIAASVGHTLALESDGTVVAFGWNRSGQTVVPEGLSGVAAVAAGSDHSLALRSDGTVVAWGDNSYGQTAVPENLSGVFAIAAGNNHSLALVDATAPVLALPDDQNVEAATIAGAPVMFAVSATDDLDRNPSVRCDPPSGTTFPLGRTVVTCDATDAAGNVATGSFVVKVIYAWSGFLPPINSDGSSIFKAGRAIPVKFSLSGSSASIANATATLSFARLSANVEGTIVEATTNVEATSGNLFRYSDGQYIFNWSTKDVGTGTFVLKVDLGDAVDRSTRVSLR